MAFTFDQRGSTCLYYDHSSNTNGNYGTVRSCYINEQLDDVIEGIMKQGEWSHIVFVTGKMARVKILLFSFISCLSSSSS